MTGQKALPARIVTGVAACMVVATAAATAVGFWLSYRGLHDFALRAGLHGAIHPRVPRRPLPPLPRQADHPHPRVAPDT